MEPWKILREQAQKFKSWSSTLQKSDHAEGAFYLAHMACELVMKSAIARKNLGWHPTDTRSHDLIGLISDRKTQFIFQDMANDQNTNVHPNFIQVTSRSQAWKMQYRYEGTKLSDGQMLQSVQLYEEIFQWTLKHYVQ